MDGFAQVGRRRVGCKVGPEQGHDLFAVQAMRVGQREDLDQFGCPLVPPRTSRHRLAVDTNHEPAQQPDLVAGHHLNIDGGRLEDASLLEAPSGNVSSWPAARRHVRAHSWRLGTKTGPACTV
jgi:hypothetical protein